MDPWPHQLQGVSDTLSAIEKGLGPICLTSPTGGGKTLMELMLAQHYLEQGRRVVLYTNRRLLVDQTSRVLAASGLDHGIRASGYADQREKLLQVSSMQTEAARSIKTGPCPWCSDSTGFDSSCFSCRGTGRVEPKWELHDAHLVLVDEAHLQKEATAQAILAAHAEKGADIVGITATPLDVGHIYRHLVVAGNTSELRKCGALVQVIHYACGEPHPDLLKGAREGEDLTEKQARKAIMSDGIFGRVLEWFDRINPTRRPSILFAPDVASSVWFAQQFEAAGITAAHIDGQDIWVSGQVFKSSRSKRQEVLDGSKSGAIRVLCNRFVLREGIDAPWLSHGIFATVFGRLQSCLQSGGRLLRSFSGLENVTLQDHGGNWWRHGSLNSDREWNLALTGTIVSVMRADALRSKRCRLCQAELRPLQPICPECGANNEPEPVCCPQCGLVLARRSCPCGWKVTSLRSRPVYQSDGTLVEMQGNIYQPRRIAMTQCAKNDWIKMIRYQCREATSGERTFKAAAAAFAVKHGNMWPDPNWPLTPVDPLDWWRNVHEVEKERLR